MSTESVMQSDGQDLFNELVNQPGVCRNCFEKTHEVYERFENRAELKTSLKGILSREVYFPEVDIVTRVYPPEKSTSYPASRNICSCGVFLPWTVLWDKENPLSRDMLERNAKNLCNRMEEMGIDFNRRRFIELVHDKKSQPEYQNRDSKLFHDALEEEVNSSRIEKLRKKKAATA